MAISQFFWLLTYVPVIPASPVQLGLAVWVLIPQNEGEKVVYMILSGYFKQFEQFITLYRNMFFEFVFRTVLSLARVTTDYCLTRIRSEQLIEIRKVTE